LCGGNSGPELLCEHCSTSLPPLPEHCPRCALPSPRGALCGGCLTDPPRFDATTALWLYEFPCDRLVQALKYRGRLALASFFGAGLASRAFTSELIIPMPLHPNRLAERGFNQAVEIARSLSRRSGTVVLPRGARRVKDTAPQADLPYEDRVGNIRDAFACDLDLSGRRVSIVDDVMTTGATLNELARILKRAGAVRVENLVIARCVLRQ